LRIAQVSTHDQAGGAARAAYNLQTGLRERALDAHLFVQRKTSSSPYVTGPQGRFAEALGLFRSFSDRLPASFYPQRTERYWGVNWLPFPPLSVSSLHEFDIVHLHWFCAGFLPVSFLGRIGRPIVWTLHDMWAFTGGCHYCGECTRYTERCGACPQLGSRRENDLSRHIWERKKHHWQNLDLTIISPSRWLADCVKQSSLLNGHDVHVVPNCIDTEVFSPLDRYESRRRLSLPLDRKLIVFGAMNALGDQRKGFRFIPAAIKSLRQMSAAKNFELLVYGASQEDQLLPIDFPVHYFGRISDDARLCTLLSAADVMLIPSTEDNLPYVVMEAMACGLPCVAFSVGGIPEMIDHENNGYLARPGDSEDLARGLSWVLADDTRLRDLSLAARSKVVNHYTMKHIARAHEELYRSICGKRDGTNPSLASSLEQETDLLGPHE